MNIKTPISPPSAIRSIVFIGAECTGKTTLTKKLSAHFKEPFSTEYVRLHVEKLNNERPLDASDLEPIARGQLQLEDQAIAKAKKLVIHDTNLLSSILYAEHYFDTHISWVDQAFLQRKYDQYFLCEPDMPWEADPGQREGPEVRAQLHLLFEQTLNRYGIPFIKLQGNLEQRFQTVLHTIEHL